MIGMSDDTTPRNQFNLRLNEVASRQLEELSDLLNISKAAVILQAVSLMHKKYFPPHPPPPPTGTPPTPTGKG